MYDGIEYKFMLYNQYLFELKTKAILILKIWAGYNKIERDCNVPQFVSYLLIRC